MDMVITRLKHQELFGTNQQGTCGLGWGEPQKMWDMAVTEMIRMEEDKPLVKSVGQCQQGQWTKQECILPRAVAWNDQEAR